MARPICSPSVSKLSIFRQYLAVSIFLVLKNFIKTVYSKIQRIKFSEQASRTSSNTGLWTRSTAEKVKQENVLQLATFYRPIFSKLFWQDCIWGLVQSGLGMP